jgi:hypothetical protein
MEMMKYRGLFYQRLYERRRQTLRQMSLLDKIVVWCLG